MGVLEGVVICVARSLSDRQITLNDLAKQLGGDFRWHFDKSVSTDYYLLLFWLLYIYIYIKFIFNLYVVFTAIKIKNPVVFV